MQECFIFPCSYAQSGLWIIDQLTPGEPTYNIPLRFRIHGALDVAAIEQALNDIISRHEVLRTTIAMHDGQPVQLIARSLQLKVEVIDFDGIPNEVLEAHAEALSQEEASKPFDLTLGPLIRALVLRMTPSDVILLLTIHHIVFDGWSISVFNRELAAFYEAHLTGRPANLAELPVQYADYACWQRAYLQGEALSEQLAYWREQLAGAPTVLALPTDRPRPAVQTFQGASVDFALPPELSAALRALSQREGVTLFMTFLAAFQVLLARYSGQDDIVVGTPVAGRTRAELEGLIGFFVNTLPLRTKLDGNSTFRELLHRVRDVALGAYAHQDVPFEKLVEELRPERSLERNPIFQVLINFLNVPNTSLTFPQLSAEVADVGSQSVRFPLTLYINDRDSHIALQFLYHVERFSPDRMQEVMDQFIYLLDQAVRNPDDAIDSYSLVTQAASRTLPNPRASLSAQHYPPMPTEFLQWVKQAPQSPAVRQGNRTWTYEEIAQSAVALAQRLHERGMRRGEVVAVTGPRSCGYIVGMLAVLFAGGILLTLDSRLPPKRRHRMLITASCRCILQTGEDAIDPLWSTEADISVLSWHQPDPGRCYFDVAIGEMEAMSSRLGDNGPAYVFFTSGTTGTPKGILGCHNGLSHFLAWQREHFGVGPGDRSAQLTGLSFDVLLRDVFMPLTSGALLCLPEDPDNMAAEYILPWLEEEEITLLHTVPAIIASWLSSCPAGVSLRSLRQVFFAGEPLPGALVARWRTAFPASGALANLYGPSETSLAKLCYELPGEVPPGIQPVGWPLPSTQALVLAPNGRLCGIAEPGEIVIRTPYRSLGYIGATAEDWARFMPNYFGQDEDDILYRTGDRGRYRSDGALEILGRLDDQVKIRGVRVEPGEVAALLFQHPKVQECIVLGCADRMGEKFLAAYVVSANEDGATIQELRAFLAEHVPDYMCPSAFLFVDELPLTANGKVDRQSLPIPSPSTSRTEMFEAPRSAVEVVLAEIWMDVLQIDRIGIHDNFFELGGHSLLAARVMWRVRDAFNVEMQVRALFESQTIAGLGAAILAAPKRAHRSHVGPIISLPRELQRHHNLGRPTSQANQ